MKSLGSKIALDKFYYSILTANCDKHLKKNCEIGSFSSTKFSMTCVFYDQLDVKIKSKHHLKNHSILRKKTK
jgi:hypothetical protein